MVRLLFIVLPLGLDTFALSTLLGVLPLALPLRLRIAFIFAAAEGLMPAVGLLLGLPVGNAVGRWSPYLAGILLIGLGLWLWFSEWREKAGDDEKDGESEEEAKLVHAVTSSGWSLVALAVSISLDELAVGFSFGVLGLPLVPVLVLIVLQALLVSLAGQWIGHHLGKRLGEYAEKLVGPVLCLLGGWFVVAQLLNLPL